MKSDFNLLEFADLCEDHPWELEQPTPTDLRLVIENTQMDMEEVGKHLASFVGESIEAEEIESPDGDIDWTMRVRVNGLPTDVVIWVEPLNDATRDSTGVKNGSILAVQTILHKGDPLTHFSNLMRLFGGIDIPLHSVCDLSTGRWFTKEIIETVFVQDTIEPPEEVLWITRLVESPETSEPEDRWAWVTTHGLTRCGRVELEMLGVPAVQSSEAVQLIDGLAALTLESPLPSTGQPISLGSQLTVSLLSCNEAIALLLKEMPRGENRKTPSVVVAHHDGMKICPQDALRSMSSGNSSIIKSQRSTSRQASFAQLQWSVFVKAAKQIGDNEHATCLVQVPWSNTDDEDSPREYLWFRVVEVNNGLITGELAHTPALVTSLRQGHKEQLTPTDVTDWVVMTPVGPMGPQDAEAIEEFLG
jgi:uncharacterized protein YegJ (DUF2314 family)